MIIQSIKQLPLFLQEIREYQLIFHIMDIYLNDCWRIHDAMYQDQYISLEMSEEALERWERICSLSPYPTEDKNSRVNNVLVSINKKTPYTIKSLHRYIASLIDENCFKIEVDYQNLTLTFEFYEESGHIPTDVERSKQVLIQNFITEILPACGTPIFKEWGNKIVDLEATPSLEYLENYTCDEIEKSRHVVQDYQ